MKYTKICNTVKIKVYKQTAENETIKKKNKKLEETQLDENKNIKKLC